MLTAGPWAKILANGSSLSAASPDAPGTGRWRLGRLNRFGRKNWKGLEVDLRPEPLRGTRVHKHYEGD